MREREREKEREKERAREREREKERERAIRKIRTSRDGRLCEESPGGRAATDFT